MSSEKESPGNRRNIRTTVGKISRDITHASKDIATASKTLAESTSKWVQDVAPKVSAEIDEAVDKASESFERTMTDIATQTRPQQVKLLKSYRSFLSKQIDLIEKRLKKLSS